MLAKKTKSASVKKARHALRSRRTLPKRLLLHPLSTFGMLVVGVLLAGLTFQALAADYDVNAVVAAEPLTEGAVITSPTDNQTVTSTPITVSGTCPNTAYVKLYRNGAFSGVAFCTNGAFTITSDLFVGANDLQAQPYNITDVAGPQTAVVHVVYQPSAGVQTHKKTTTANAAVPNRAASQAPLLLQSDYHFNVATTNSEFNWKLQYQYAVPPINTSVSWGDGTTSQYVVPANGSFKIQHKYAERGYYVIVITGNDAEERTVVMQLVAYIKKPGDAATKGNILPIEKGKGSGNNGLSNLKWLVYAWPTYIVVAVMGVSFWLGERRELMVLTKAKASHALGHRRIRHT